MMHGHERSTTRKAGLPRYVLALVWLLAAVAAPGAARAQWTTNGTNINNTNTGNVGVGTTAPIRGLQVSGPNGSGSSEFVLENTGMPANYRKFNLWGAATLGTAGRFFIRVLNDAGNATTRDFMSFDNATGNVGIGTNSPNQTLSVAGTGAFYNSTPVQPSGVRGLFMGNFSVGSSIWSYNYVAGTGDPLHVSAQDINLATYVGGNGVSRLFVTNGGNVGIGTTSPAAALEVRRDHATGTELKVSNADAGGFAGVYLNGGFAQGAGGFLQWNNVTGSNNLFVATAGNSPLHFGTNNAVRMTVLPASGNVGIGTTTPASQLFVGGGAAAVAALPGLNVALGGNSYVSASNGAINTFLGSDTSGYGIVGTLSNHSLGLRANNTLAMTITPVGNVGVGTNAPAHKLDVAGNVNASGLCLGGTCKSTWSEIGGTGGGGSGWTDAGATLSLSNPSANVGVGTASPRGKLEVAGGSLFLGDMGQPAWGNMVVRGRVLSANNNVHISPPGGTGVYIDSNYREAGGGAGPVNLHVSGDVTVGGNINAKYQDVAEWVPSTQKLNAGTVVVLDAERDNHVSASARAYDTAVAGVISARPGISLGEAGEGKVLVATTGRVKVKVDASKGAIKIGDLIVTSEVEGVAMKSVPVDLGGTLIHRPGTIIGKALERLEKGTGEILVLLSLQ